MAQLNLDNMVIEVPDQVAAVIKNAFDSKESEIAKLNKELTVKQDACSEKKTEDRVVKVGDSQYDISTSAGIDKLSTDFANTLDALMSAKKEREALVGKKDALEAELSGLKSDSNTDNLAELVRKRIALERSVEPFLKDVKDLKMDSMTDRQIKETAIKARWPAFDKLDTMTADRIDGMFTVLLQEPSKENDGVTSLKNDLSQSTISQDSSTDRQEALNNAINAVQNAWKKTLKMETV